LLLGLDTHQHKIYEPKKSIQPSTHIKKKSLLNCFIIYGGDIVGIVLQEFVPTIETLKHGE
jgi:hypothetical protein